MFQKPVKPLQNLQGEPKNMSETAEEEEEEGEGEDPKAI